MILTQSTGGAKVVNGLFLNVFHGMLLFLAAVFVNFFSVFYVQFGHKLTFMCNVVFFVHLQLAVCPACARLIILYYYFVLLLFFSILEHVLRARRSCRGFVFLFRQLIFNENDAFWGEFRFAPEQIAFDLNFVRLCLGMSGHFGDKYVYFYNSNMVRRFSFLQK